MTRNETLQRICRKYLTRLLYIADKHGLGDWVREIRKMNKSGNCSATEHEVEMLSRLVNDERATRTEIPQIIGMTLRQCNDNDEFKHIKKLPRVGIYSKVSAMLYADKIKKQNP